jgi:hypothetical protein
MLLDYLHYYNSQLVFNLPHTLEKRTKYQALPSLPATPTGIYVYMLDWQTGASERAESQNQQWPAIVLSVRYLPNCCSLNGEIVKQNVRVLNWLPEYIPQADCVLAVIVKSTQCL